MYFIHISLGGDYELTVRLSHSLFECYRNQENVRVVKTGWADKLDAIIQKKVHLPCVTVGRRAKYRSKDIASSDGYCQEKLCNLRISSTLPHTSNTLTVTLENYVPDIVHNVLRPE